VLVIDNNTADPELWLPVKAHCEWLGGRFRFLHVEGLTGAKAGALNWALGHTCPRAELIAVVDADYQVRRRWLAATAEYFADPGMGFVQCPHAYRGYAWSALGRWANWEYAVFFATGPRPACWPATCCCGGSPTARSCGPPPARPWAGSGLRRADPRHHHRLPAGADPPPRPMAAHQQVPATPARHPRAHQASTETVLGAAGLLAAAGLAA
jgi:hypothetical protein